jgi:glycerol uptake facilitator-like aquaporin
MSNWMTPEEIARKRDFRKKMMYVAIPVIGAILGTIIGILSQIM